MIYSNTNSPGIEGSARAEWVPDKYMARLLMVSFFLPMKLQGLVTMAAGLYFVVRTVAKKQGGRAKNYLSALFIGSAYLLFLVSFLFTPGEYQQSLSLMSGQRVSFFLMPFVFVIISRRFAGLLAGELIFFAYGCFITCLAANAGFVYFVYASGGGLHSFTHVQYRTEFHLFTDIHPTYMGMYLCFAICVLLFSPVGKSRYGAMLKYGLLFSLLVFLLALGPKAPILALALIFVHYAFTHRAALWRHRILLGSLSAAIAAAAAFIPFFRQRLAETIDGLREGGGASADNSIAMRKVIWNIDTSMLRHYWLTGVGPGRLMHTLREHYFFYSLVNPFQVPYHDPHSEYFYQWLSFGIPGLVLFTVILAAHFRRACLDKDALYAYLLVILCVTFFTETVLSMQRGVLFYAVFTSFFFFFRPLASKSVLNPVPA